MGDTYFIIFLIKINYFYYKFGSTPPNFIIIANKIINMNKGIYAIICSGNGKMYIGHSFNLKERKRNHWKDLKKGKYYGRHTSLQKDWDLYGSGEFKFVVVESVGTESLSTMLQKEEDYIIRFGTFFEDKGYNICMPAQMVYRKSFIEQHGEEFLRELIHPNDDLLLSDEFIINKEHRGRRVIQINNKNEIVKIWKNRYEIQSYYNISIKRSEKIIFNTCINSNIKRKLYKGFVWVYENNYDKNFDYSIAYIRKTILKKVKPPKIYKKAEDYKRDRKSVSFRHMSTGEIRKFPSISKASSEMGFNVCPLVNGKKKKGSGKVVNITQWKGWEYIKEF